MDSRHKCGINIKYLILNIDNDFMNRVICVFE